MFLDSTIQALCYNAPGVLGLLPSTDPADTHCSDIRTTSSFLVQLTVISPESIWMTKLGYIAILRHLILLVGFRSSHFEAVVTLIYIS